MENKKKPAKKKPAPATNKRIKTATKKAISPSTKIRPASANKKSPLTTKKSPQRPARKPSVKAATASTQPSQKQTVLVTGAAGFVGGHMVEELIENGYKVIAMDFPGSNMQIAINAGAETAEADITSVESVESLFAGGKIDSVIHLAALYDLGAQRDKLMRVNRDGSQNVFSAARRAGVKRLIFFSTGDVYGQPDKMPISEDVPPNPLNPYSESKFEAEKIALEMYRNDGFPVTIIRPTVIYGPRSRYIASVFFSIPGIVRSIGDRINLYLPELTLFTGGALVSWVHARDLAAAVRFLLEKEEAVGQIYNVADDNPLPIDELFKIMFKVFGYEWKSVLPYPRLLISTVAKMMQSLPDAVFEHITQFMQTEWARMIEKHGLTNDFQPRFDRDFVSFMFGDRVYDNSKIKALGFTFPHPDSRDGFLETIEWYRQNHWLPEE